jgi:hypothetical protein
MMKSAELIATIGDKEIAIVHLRVSTVSGIEVVVRLD